MDSNYSIVVIQRLGIQLAFINLEKADFFQLVIDNGFTKAFERRSGISYGDFSDAASLHGKAINSLAISSSISDFLMMYSDLLTCQMGLPNIQHQFVQVNFSQKITPDNSKDLWYYKVIKPFYLQIAFLQCPMDTNQLRKCLEMVNSNPLIIDRFLGETMDIDREKKICRIKQRILDTIDKSSFDLTFLWNNSKAKEMDLQKELAAKLKADANELAYPESSSIITDRIRSVLSSRSSFYDMIGNIAKYITLLKQWPSTLGVFLRCIVLHFDAISEADIREFEEGLKDLFGTLEELSQLLEKVPEAASSPTYSRFRVKMAEYKQKFFKQSVSVMIEEEIDENMAKSNKKGVLKDRQERVKEKFETKKAKLFKRLAKKRQVYFEKAQIEHSQIIEDITKKTSGVECSITKSVIQDKDNYFILASCHFSNVSACSSSRFCALRNCTL